jgi:hypothetical protein
MARRYAELAVSSDLIESALTRGIEAMEPAHDRLPSDSKIVGASYDARDGAVILVFESESFKPLQEGELPKRLTPGFRRVTDG